MTSDSLLIPIAKLSANQRRWLDFGLISKISEGDEQFVLGNQLKRLDFLTKQASKTGYSNPHPTSLFPSNNEIFLGEGTVLIDCRPDNLGIHTDEILYQLLPGWIEEADRKNRQKNTNKWNQILLGEIEVLSKNAYLLERILDAQKSISNLLGSRTAQFARSASYMGSKATLAPYFVEILKDSVSKDSSVFDLMCGSGAASGIFSKHWKTVASDAQIFSRMLAVVQGGGMDGTRARAISDEVLSNARVKFNDLPDFLKQSIEIESDFLSSELSNEALNALSEWISNYPRINSQIVAPDVRFVELVEKAKNATENVMPVLFSAYYGNLFFGVRQAAEIDCLRAAIEELTDEIDKRWALGALICAVSSRAYSYGGHFAQPKLDCSDHNKIQGLAPEMLVSWGQSVSHEFFVRLTNLGNESLNNEFPIEQIEGPWEKAIAGALSNFGEEEVCVYLDPPYTRDEYSRYYHVLETLVRYDYPDIQNKPSIPKRGQAGRFASDFATRSKIQIEMLIIKIINACLVNNWSCLWSYSSSGSASIKKILDELHLEGFEIHMFSMDYSYKAQGKSRKKDVKEHAVFIRKNNSVRNGSET